MKSALFAAAVLASPVLAQTASFHPIPPIANAIGTPLGTTPHAVSGDGRVVVGSGPGTSTLAAFRWVIGEPLPQVVSGPMGCGSNPAWMWHEGWGCSRDGSVVVGLVNNNCVVPGVQGFRWSPTDWIPSIGIASGGWLNAQVQSNLYGCNADGTLACGASSHMPVLWSAAGGFQSLAAATSGDRVAAYAMSADGGVVVGNYGAGIGKPFRWTPQTGLVVMVQSEGYGTAQGVSPNGLWVVGSGKLTGGTDPTGFRWSESTGFVNISGGVKGRAVNRVSNDGRRVVGAFGTGALPTAGVWDDGRGWRSVVSLLAERGVTAAADWTLTEVTGLSDDGTVMCGTGSDSTGRTGWVAAIPMLSCGTSDFDNDGDFGTDFDIQAFFACLGGSCCPTCYALGADFNSDGDTGTDADIESFFRVLGGGPC